MVLAFFRQLPKVPISCRKARIAQPAAISVVVLSCFLPGPARGALYSEHAPPEPDPGEARIVQSRRFSEVCLHEVGEMVKRRVRHVEGSIAAHRPKHCVAPEARARETCVIPEI